MSQKTRYQAIPYHLILIFCILSVSFCLAGYQYYVHQREHIRLGKQDELAAIADLKVNQIANWRKERLGDAGIIFGNRLMNDYVREFLERPGTALHEREILNWLQCFKQQYSYHNILLLDGTGNIRISATGEKEMLGPDAKRLAAEALQKRQVVFSDLYRSKTTNLIRLTLVVPVVASHRQKNVPIGAFLLRIDPQEFLYALIQSWPTGSATAETIMVRREDNEIVYLNELRHRKNTALDLRVSDPGKDHVLAMVRGGIEGVAEGIDYRGVPVLVATRMIPDSPWFLIAKVDQDEVFATVREHFWFTLVLVNVFIISAGAVLGFIWRNQRASFYRQQYEAELERVALIQHYEYLTKYANDIILLMDTNGRLTEVNERAVSAYGYSRDELLQMNIQDIRASEALSDLDYRLRELHESGGLVYETYHQKKDKTVFPVEVSARLIEIEGKKYFQSIIREISERKEAEFRILEEKKLSDSVINSLPGVFYLFDENNRFLRWNRNLEAVSGYSSEEISRMSPLEFFAGEENILIGKAVEEVFAQGESVIEANLVSKDGSRTPYFFTGLRFVSSTHSYLIGTGIDISKRKKTEEELHALNEELEQRVALRTRQLETANRELEAFSYSVSHDLRAPLRSIDGFSQAIQEDFADRLDTEGIDYLQRIRRASQHMGQLIDDMLNLSRVARYEMKHEEVDLSALVRAITADLMAAHPGRDMKCVIEDGVIVNGDFRLLRIMLENLLNNAWKFSARNTEPLIQFGTTEYKERKVCFIRDNGAGFNMKYAVKLFDPFQRLHTQAEFPGTGVGLAIVYRIIQRHGGQVWAESEEGRGATFYFAL
ncbi:MAG: PAS domain S-box protein [Nitrospirota bacterium]